ncbi:MAG: methyltransferase family protein [Candidatus Thorarchaeota archaeon]
MSTLEKASSYMLPISVLILVPWFLMWLTADTTIGWSLAWSLDLLVMFVGLTLLLTGVLLVVACIRMFTKIGEGTIAPWAPTQKLVVVGVYRYMRNPMITGVLFGLLGESIILSNYAVFLWFLLFFIGNHIYFIKSEEPGLLKRFGEEYVEYFENVPRWLPRITPWEPSKNRHD